MCIVPVVPMLRLPLTRSHVLIDPFSSNFRNKRLSIKPGKNLSEAGKQLLHISHSYAVEAGEMAESSAVRSYQRDLVSIPSVGQSAPHVCDVIDPTGQHVLDDVQHNFLISDNAWGEKKSFVKPYMDVRLAKSKKLYFQFVKDLLHRKCLYLELGPSVLARHFSL